MSTCSDCCTVIVPPTRSTLSTAPPGMFIAAASVGGSPMARTEYGGCQRQTVDRQRARRCRRPRCRRRPGRPGCPHSTSIASAPAARSSLMTSSMVSGATPRAGSSMAIVTPGPGGGDRPDQDRQRGQPGPGVVDGGLVRGARRLQRRQGALQFGHLGVQRGLALLQGIQQHQQVGGPGRFQRVAGFGLAGLGGDGDAEQQAQHDARASPNTSWERLRPAVARRAAPSGRAALPGGGSAGSVMVLTLRTAGGAARRRCRRCGFRAPR